MLNYWWVTRPKRKLNSIPEVLAAFSNVALSVRWSAARNVHILFEEELERDGLKRIGERRDHSGSGGRTYQAWLSSLGLIFIQESTGTPFLTLAGEAILEGKSPVEILKAQVLKYQFPSPFGIKTHVSDRFRVHPFIFLLRLLSDSRITYLTEEEIDGNEISITTHHYTVVFRHGLNGKYDAITDTISDTPEGYSCKKEIETTKYGDKTFYTCDYSTEEEN